MMYHDCTSAKDETEIHSPDSLPAEADQILPRLPKSVIMLTDNSYLQFRFYDRDVVTVAMLPTHLLPN